jgi:hypothetical protein
VIIDGEDVTRRPGRMNFVGCNDVSDPLRGREMFERVAELLPEVARVSQNLNLETDRCGLYVILMPENPWIVAQIERLATVPCRCRVIVDVHANLWDETVPLTVEDPDWWGPETTRRLERSIRAADLVTVPTPALAAVVSALNPRVAIVPDCHGGDDTAATLAWTQATLIAAQRDRGRET